MQYLDTKNVYTTKLDDLTVLVEARDGAEVDHQTSANNIAAMVAAMPGDFGMIIMRKPDYSIVPIDVYKNLNQIEKLKAIALVLPNNRNFLPVSTEQKLYKGKLEAFAYIREAHEWICGVLKQPGA